MLPSIEANDPKFAHVPAVTSIVLDITRTLLMSLIVPSAFPLHALGQPVLFC
jgi:hypothetical protein